MFLSAHLLWASLCSAAPPPPCVFGEEITNPPVPIPLTLVLDNTVKQFQPWDCHSHLTMGIYQEKQKHLCEKTWDVIFYPRKFHPLSFSTFNPLVFFFGRKFCCWNQSDVRVDARSVDVYGFVLAEWKLMECICQTPMFPPWPLLSSVSCSVVAGSHKGKH